MEPGGRRRNCARLFGKDRLVSRTVRVFVVTLDVQRQRHVAELLNCLFYAAIGVCAKSNGSQTEFPTPDDFAFQLFLAENHFFSNRQLAAGTYQGLPRFWR